jgi:hypothetical protein
MPTKLSINDVGRLKKILSCAPDAVKRRMKRNKSKNKYVGSTISNPSSSDHMKGNGFSIPNINSEISRAILNREEARNEVAKQVGYESSPLMLGYDNAFKEQLLKERDESQRKMNYLYNAGNGMAAAIGYLQDRIRPNNHQMFPSNVEEVMSDAESIADDNHDVSKTNGSEHFLSERDDPSPIVANPESYNYVDEDRDTSSLIDDNMLQINTNYWDDDKTDALKAEYKALTGFLPQNVQNMTGIRELQTVLKQQKDGMKDFQKKK